MFLTHEDISPIYRQAVDIAASALPNSEVVLLPGQQHMAHHMDPELLATEVLRFLGE